MNVREIVLDTETTGLSPLKGDRLVEIGCVEIVNLLPTGNVFHRYINPERDVPEGASRVHGLTNDFLADKPVFAAEVDGFLEFIGEAPLVIHNAPFDMGFVNAELTRCGFRNLPMGRAVDTLPMARKKFPGAPASLDALCKRFGVDLSSRDFHGALLDARLLADVYLELMGGRQPDLVVTKSADVIITEAPVEATAQRSFRGARVHQPSPEEGAAHEAWLEKIKNPLWKSAG